MAGKGAPKLEPPVSRLTRAKALEGHPTPQLPNACAQWPLAVRAMGCRKCPLALRQCRSVCTDCCRSEGHSVKTLVLLCRSSASSPRRRPRTCFKSAAFAGSSCQPLRCVCWVRCWGHELHSLSRASASAERPPYP